MEYLNLCKMLSVDMSVAELHNNKEYHMQTDMSGPEYKKLDMNMSVAELQVTKECWECKDGDQAVPEVKVTDIIGDEYMQISGEVAVTGPEMNTSVLMAGRDTNNLTA